MRTTATTLCVLFVTLGFWADDARAQIDAEIPYTNTPPTIDGMGSDFDPVWDGVIEHGPEEFNTVLGEEPEDLADLSVTWKALWDEDNLYVLVKISFVACLVTA